MLRLASLTSGMLLALAVNVTAAAQVRVSIADGRVSIVANDATVAEIVTEWAKVGQIKVVNLDLVPRERVTIELRDASDQQALAVLLRRGGGYIASRRATADPNVSGLERILIVPFAPPPPAVNAAVAPPAANSEAADPADAEQTAAARAVAEAMQRQQQMLMQQPQQPAPQAAPQQTAEQIAAEANAMGDALAVAAPAIVASPTEAQAQAAFKQRKALETSDASKFKFPKPQPVVQPVTVPRGPGGR